MEIRGVICFKYPLTTKRLYSTIIVQNKNTTEIIKMEEKNFELADAIRAELLEKGVEIKDTREGVVWKLI